jgi:hypothetical protein
MRAVLLIVTTLSFFSSCSMRSFVTPAATISGAAVGAIGGPGGAALGAGTGYAAGRIYELDDEKKELVDSITKGDVSAIVASGLQEHQSGFDEFTGSIKSILMVAGSVLLAYLLIPIFLVKKCAKQEAIKHMTRPPFPVKPPPRK